MYSFHTNKPTQTIVHHPFTEETIITLHRLFLINGHHAITVQNVATGRIIIRRLVASLHYYQHIGVATMTTLPTDMDVFDIRQNLFNEGYIPETYEYLNEFFLESCQFDFLWIELSKKLQESMWFVQLEQKIKQFNLGRQLPIVYVSYIH